MKLRKYFLFKSTNIQLKHFQCCFKYVVQRYEKIRSLAGIEIFISSFASPTHTTETTPEMTSPVQCARWIKSKLSLFISEIYRCCKLYLYFSKFCLDRKLRSKLGLFWRPPSRVPWPIKNSHIAKFKNVCMTFHKMLNCAMGESATCCLLPSCALLFCHQI